MPKFEIYKDRIGGYRWRLKARNGEIIATSESYVSRYGAQLSINTVKQLAPVAMVVSM